MTDETYRVLLDAANHVSLSTWDLNTYQQAGAATPERADRIMAALDAVEQLFIAEIDAAEAVAES